MTSQRCAGGEAGRKDSASRDGDGTGTGVRGRNFRVPSQSRCLWNGPCTHPFPSPARQCEQAVATI